MKKTILKISSLLTIFWLTFNQKVIAASVDDLLPRPGVPDTEFSASNPQLETVANLPEVSAEGLITVLIRTILGWAIIITLVAIVVAGIFFIKAEGDEEKIGKARIMLIYLIIGMIIMSAAYGIVAGVIQFSPFQ